VTTAQVAAVTFGFYSDAEVHRTTSFTSKVLQLLLTRAWPVFEKHKLSLARHLQFIDAARAVLNSPRACESSQGEAVARRCAS